MSRTKKLPRWWFYFGHKWFHEDPRPWQSTNGKDNHRGYKYHRKLQQRRFRQASRLALCKGCEPPRLPPMDWWTIY